MSSDKRCMTTKPHCDDMPQERILGTLVVYASFKLSCCSIQGLAQVSPLYDAQAQIEVVCACSKPRWKPSHSTAHRLFTFVTDVALSRVNGRQIARHRVAPHADNIPWENLTFSMNTDSPLVSKRNSSYESNRVDRQPSTPLAHPHTPNCMQQAKLPRQWWHWFQPDSIRFRCDLCSAVFLRTVPRIRPRRAHWSSTRTNRGRIRKMLRALYVDGRMPADNKQRRYVRLLNANAYLLHKLPKSNFARAIHNPARTMADVICRSLAGGSSAYDKLNQWTRFQDFRGFKS